MSARHAHSHAPAPTPRDRHTALGPAVAEAVHGLDRNRGRAVGSPDRGPRGPTPAALEPCPRLRNVRAAAPRRRGPGHAARGTRRQAVRPWAAGQPPGPDQLLHDVARLPQPGRDAVGHAGGLGRNACAGVGRRDMDRLPPRWRCPGPGHRRAGAGGAGHRGRGADHAVEPLSLGRLVAGLPARHVGGDRRGPRVAARHGVRRERVPAEPRRVRRAHNRSRHPRRRHGHGSGTARRGGPPRPVAVVGGGGCRWRARLAPGRARRADPIARQPVRHLGPLPAPRGGRDRPRARSRDDAGHALAVAAALMIGATAWTVWCLASRRLDAAALVRLGRVATAAVVVVAAGLTVTTAIDATDTEPNNPRLSARLGELVDSTVAALGAASGPDAGRRGPYLVTWTDPVSLGIHGFGLLNELERRGFDVGTDEASGAAVTDHRVLAAREATAVIHLSVGSDIDAWRGKPGIEQAAYLDERSPRERDEYDRLWAEVIDGLRTSGLSELVPQGADPLLVPALDERVPKDIRDKLSRLMDIGLPTAVFVGPPDAFASAAGPNQVPG